MIITLIDDISMLLIFFIILLFSPLFAMPLYYWFAMPCCHYFLPRLTFSIDYHIYFFATLIAIVSLLYCWLIISFSLISPLIIYIYFIHWHCLTLIIIFRLDIFFSLPLYCFYYDDYHYFHYFDIDFHYFHYFRHIFIDYLIIGYIYIIWCFH